VTPMACSVTHCDRPTHRERFCALHFYRKQPSTKATRARDAAAYIRTPRGRYTTARSDAKKRDLPWLIPRNHFEVLITQPCHYCAGPLNPTGCGLDRMDNTRGYEPDNVVPCCKNCNVLKSNKYTPEETKVMMEALLAFRKRNIPDSAA
jgi:hypothetical protein